MLHSPTSTRCTACAVKPCAQRMMFRTGGRRLLLSMQLVRPARIGPAVVAARASEGRPLALS
eukprot:609535-Alexandrium_andersonii.AAC.1